MTEPFHLQGQFLYASPKKAKDAFEQHNATCWDFMTEALVLDGKSITVEFESEVPSDGFQGFDKPYVELSAGAKDGRMQLHWSPKKKSNLSCNRMKPDPRDALTQVFYPKRMSALKIRTEPHSPELIKSEELVISFLRPPKYAHRFDGLRSVSVIRKTHAQTGRTAASVALWEKRIDKAGALYSIVIFDDQSRELFRLFPGELLCIDLAFSPDGSKLAAAMCKGKKRLPAKSKKKVRSGECVLIWDLKSKAKPTKFEVDVAVKSIAWKGAATIVGTPQDTKFKARSWALEPVG